MFWEAVCLLKLGCVGMCCMLGSLRNSCCPKAVCEGERGLSVTEGGQRSAVCVSHLDGGSLGAGLWADPQSALDRAQSLLSPSQTFIFTDSPDEGLQERLGNSAWPGWGGCSLA